MKLSPITKEQWVSVIKNSLIAGVVAFVLALQATGTFNKQALWGAAVAAGTAVVKVVEKLFTEA